MEKRSVNVVKTTEKIWKGKDKSYLISEMNDQMLQEALLFAESRYILHYKAMMHHSDGEELYHCKIKELLEEAKTRTLDLDSRSKRDSPKYQVLKNSFDYAQ